MEEVVLRDRPAPHVARLIINRPAKRNAIDHAVRQALIDALAALRADGSVRALVLGGAQGVFSAGGDLPSMVGLTAEQAADRMRHIHTLCLALAGSGYAIVSAIEGIAAGAAVGMALLGDHIVIGRSARVLFPFLRLGLTPDWGQLRTLPLRVGKATAWRLVTSSEPVTGEEAFRIGLADRLVEDGEVMRAAVAEASRLAELPLGALRRTRDPLASPASSLEEELAREAGDQLACLTGAEFDEGYRAFTGKRAPDFVGKARPDRAPEAPDEGRTR